MRRGPLGGQVLRFGVKRPVLYWRQFKSYGGNFGSELSSMGALVSTENLNG